MPDYLGADQRKVNKEDDKDDKPIQGITIQFILICETYLFIKEGLTQRQEKLTKLNANGFSLKNKTPCSCCSVLSMKDKNKYFL